MGVQFATWIATLFISGLCTAALFAQGLYAPSKISGGAQIYYEDTMASLSTSMINNYRTTLMSYQTAVNANVIPSISQDQLLKWNSTLGKLSDDAKNMASATQGTVDPAKMVSYLTQALALYQDNTILTVAQVDAFTCNNNVTVTDANGAVSITKGVACPKPKLVANVTNPLAKA